MGYAGEPNLKLIGKTRSKGVAGRGAGFARARTEGFSGYWVTLARLPQKPYQGYLQCAKHHRDDPQKWKYYKGMGYLIVVLSFSPVFYQ